MNEPTEKAPAHRARRWVWRRRLGIGVLVYLVIGFVTSFAGFNLLGAVFRSGPLVGRVVDADGRGIAGAFVSYEWSGQALHGTTGCRAAAIARTDASGFYFVSWQGWRLLHVTGWGIGPVGPAIWAPGYITVPDSHGGSRLVPEAADPNSDRIVSSGVVDKSTCFGWPYRARWIELRGARFAHTYAQVCESSRVEATKVSDLGRLSGEMLDVLLAREGALLQGSPATAALGEKYRSLLKQLAWPKRPVDSDAAIAIERRDTFCAAVKTDYRASGEQLNEH